MISDRNRIHYACVSKGTTVLAELSFGDHDLESLASKCLEKTPRFHLLYSHTIRKRIYSFLMEDPFVYFAILDEDLGKPQAFGFLERVKDAFMEILKNKPIEGLNLTSRCFDEEFDPVFRGLMRPLEENDRGEKDQTQKPLQSSEVLASPMNPADCEENRMDSSDCRTEGNTSCESPLIGKASRHEKKQQLKDQVTGVRDLAIENHGRTVDKENRLGVTDDANENDGCTGRLQKNGHGRGNEQQQGRRMWRRHVQMVLFIDLVVCCILFGIWLSICKGFRCIDHRTAT